MRRGGIIVRGVVVVVEVVVVVVEIGGEEFWSKGNAAHDCTPLEVVEGAHSKVALLAGIHHHPSVEEEVANHHSRNVAHDHTPLEVLGEEAAKVHALQMMKSPPEVQRDRHPRDGRRGLDRPSV